VRILVLSDIHGNYDALKAVLERVRFDYVWVLGDLVDYGPEPHLVVDAVRSLKPDVVVMGNHDFAAAFGEDCRCEPAVHWLSTYTRENITLRLLSSEQLKWLSSLERKSVVDVGSRRFMAVHGSPRNPLFGYLRRDLSEDEKLLQLTESPLALRPRPVEVYAVVHGHTHIPGEEVVNGIRLMNPGSVGQPRDGVPKASAGVLDLESGTFEVIRAEYDVEAVIRKLKELRVSGNYLEALARILGEGSIEWLRAEH